MKYYYALALMLFFTACSKENEISGGNGEDVTERNVGKVINVISDLSVGIKTDKARYNPGETVSFTADNVPSGVKIRYRTLTKVVAEESMVHSKWTWNPPSTDFTGYLVDLYKTKDDGSQVILGSIAVDVSSDWKKYPRYGFVATFDSSKRKDGVIESEIEFLNRCHINGIQFQDWHNKHHWPLGGTRTSLNDTYKDIANRDVYTDVIKKYISVQHGYGMKSIFYNLCYGALDVAASDGVKEEWYIYKNIGHSDKDAHILPSTWKSNIYLLDPSNKEWQDYIAQRNDDIYANFDFDGYQIDQLGDRGVRYDYYGNAVNMPKAYASFINAMKNMYPEKRLIMNAVSGYGASQIATTGKVDFLYNEVWSDQNEYKDLYNIIRANNLYSSNSLSTVFAAYMDYEKNQGEFNNPGVLLTDAVMFALGASHLELGDHMLCREYFPNASLSMNGSLKSEIVRYYDFLTAYENILRDNEVDNKTDLLPSCNDASRNISINSWPPVKGSISSFSKNVSGNDVIHLLNFINVNDLSWRDLKGSMQEPKLISQIPLEINLSRKISKIWVASPDFNGGVPQELTFTQKNGEVVFTLPYLKYWTMLVLE